MEGIADERKEGKEIFTIKLPKHQRVISIICLIIFVSGLILGIATRTLFSIVVFAPLTVLGVWNCADRYKKMLVFGKDRIEVYGAFGKRKEIPYKEIERAELTDGDNTTYLTLYAKNLAKPVLKINMFFENTDLLMELAGTKRWLKDN